MLRKISSLLRLYRFDVLLLTFLAFLAGRAFTADVAPIHILEALFISLLPYNFVYTLNSITDVTEDRTNKPWRPLPSGTITIREALCWLGFLGIASTSGIIILFRGTELLLAFLVLIIGALYSVPPFELKKHSFTSFFTTGLGLVFPLFIAGGAKLLPFSLSMFLHILSVTIFKDIADIRGDLEAGRNSNPRTSLPAFLVISALLLAASAAGFCFTGFKIAAVIPAVNLLVLFFDVIFKKDRLSARIYRHLIIASAVSCLAVFFCIEFFIKR